MGLTKKTPPQLSAAGDGPNTKKGAENLTTKSSKPFNHWAILDEIEAPMWADLNLECDSAYEDKDEEWFHISHPFHQCSARKLISTNSTFGIQEQSSPKLQSSVSKTSDKDYKTRKQESVSCRSTSNNPHQLKSSSSKSSLSIAGPEKSIKDNALDGKVSNEKNSAETNALVSSKSAANFSNRNTSTKSVAFQSNSTITTTSAATEGKQSQSSILPLGSSSELLSNLRDSLRKSYVTRQASRVEMKGMRKSEGSLSKSSVGSTSYTGRDGMKSVITDNMDTTPDSRNIMTMSEYPTEIVNQANVHVEPATSAQRMSCKSNLHINKEAKATDHKKQTEGCVTQKVNKRIPLRTSTNSTRATGINHSSRIVNGGQENQSRKVALDIKTLMRMKKHTEGCVTQKVNKCISLSASSNSARPAGISRSSRTVNGGGKENQSGKMATDIKSSMRMKGDGDNSQDPKVVKKKLHQTSDRTKLAGQRENFSAGGKVKKRIGTVTTVHFR